MAICLVVKVEAKEDKIANKKPIKFTIGGEFVLLSPKNTNIIVGGSSLFDRTVEAYNLAREKERETIARERLEQRYKQSPSLEADKSVEIIGRSNLQCVVYFKQRSGVTRSLGYAGRIRPQGFTPTIGSGALFKEYGHIGYVTQVNDSTIVVEHSNWIRGKVVRQVLSRDKVRGYIYN